MFESDKALELETRNRIFTAIQKNPGLHFRELQRRTGIAVGSLQYHLDRLQKENLVRASKEGNYVRYYSVREAQTEEDKAAMNLLRQPSARKIILFLLQRKNANNSRIAQFVGLSPSTVSWHLEKLVKAEVLTKEQSQRETIYSVANPEHVSKLIVSYKASFLDELVDRFVEVWEEI